MFKVRNWSLVKLMICYCSIS